MKVKESILIVDDDLDFLGVIKRILETRGFEVETAPSASKAISRMKERFFNAAILDISLPDADGTELLSKLLDINEDIIAIMLTGHSSVRNAVQSLNRGAFAYLEKPLDPENLLSVIRRGLEKQHLVMENQRLMEELEQRNHISDTLLSISQAVSESLNLQHIIDSALDRVADTTGIEASFVYLLVNDKLSLTGYHGLSARTANKFKKETDAVGEMLAEILEESESFVIEELAEHKDQRLRFLEDSGFRSFVAIPLSILGENIGIMGVASSFNQCFNAKIVELLNGIGREIAIAVRNAQLYEEASSARALRELDSMRTEFLANVSHELRTPLAVIKGSANSLLQPDVIFDDQTRREFLQSIDKDADTLTRLVDDLLMMSRLEADALEVKKKPVHIAQLIDSIKERLENLTVRHRLVLDIPNKLPRVGIDEGRIAEVITNLVENAVKFSEENTPITIKAESNSTSIIMSVTDEGIGVPSELHQKIFDRFFQGNVHTTGNRKGTGLGLAICQGIVEAHSGSIWIDSKPGKGTRFSFSLPLS
jgi:K+-sensing histidine kinase KdpD